MRCQLAHHQHRAGVGAPLDDAQALVTRRYIVPALGSRRLDKLTAMDVRAWLNRLRKPMPVLLRPGWS
jgi:hypothetical protein